MKKFFADFKEFALKGNIIDMAVGVVIGAAFGKIVTSLVTDIITPLISLLTGSGSLTDLAVVLKTIPPAEEGAEEIKVMLTYGNFLQAIIDFFLIALSIFIVLRIIMTAKAKVEALKKKEEEEAEEEEEADTELSVLLEIRDYLKKDEPEEAADGEE